MEQAKTRYFVEMMVDQDESEMLDRFKRGSPRFGVTMASVLLPAIRQFLDEHEHLLSRTAVVSPRDLKRIAFEKLGIVLTKQRMLEFRKVWPKGSYYWEAKAGVQNTITYDLGKVWLPIVEHFRKVGHEIPVEKERVPRYDKALKRRKNLPVDEEVTISGVRAIGWVEKTGEDD